MTHPRAPVLVVTYCYRSPFCALVVEDLFRLPSQFAITLHWRLVEETPRPSSLPITADNPRFAYNRQDCARRGRWLGLNWNPPEWRLRDVRAATAIGQFLLMRDLPAFEPFSVAVSRAYWCDGRDITDAAVAAAIAREQGAEDALIAEALADNGATRAVLAENMQACDAAGVLGVPFFQIDGEGFWGSDRVADLQTFMTERGYRRPAAE